MVAGDVAGVRRRRRRGRNRRSGLVATTAAVAAVAAAAAQVVSARRVADVMAGTVLSAFRFLHQTTPFGSGVLKPDLRNTDTTS